NDAFGTAHRDHASNTGITEEIPRNVAGRLMVREINILNSLLDNPAKPFVVISGGKKINTKLKTITNLPCDKIFLGGIMANTFMKARGDNIGKSKYEEDELGTAEEFRKKAGEKLVLPKDVVITDDLKEPTKIKTVLVEDLKNDNEPEEIKKEFPEGWVIADIGEETRKEIDEAVNNGKTAMWNGPVGFYETDEFAEGTISIGRSMANATGQDVKTIIASGDIPAALEKAYDIDLENDFTHICTGGGAALKALAGKELVGVACINEKK
ncbi:MAG: phosphoglycerate kinase, partial [Candidatus Aenigmarchaeota archaeon]|nr:phosphoglycerate kinase [Candidatus Aenigmarchaeota archaeon]